MLEINFDLSNFDEVEIVPIADVHIGNPLCDIGALKDIIEYVKEEPSNPRMARICVLNGDLTDSVTKKSVGDPFEATMSPQLQVATILEMLKPLTEPKEGYPQGKILSYCGGNHDNDRYKETGISASQAIAVGLGLEKRYSDDGCYSFISLNRLQDNGRTVIATVYNQHMTGGGSTVGGKANRVAKISSAVLAQVIIGSHVHTPLTFKEDIIVPSNRSLEQHTITYLITNAFLKYGDYAQKYGYKPSTIQVPRLFIKQTRTDFRSGCKRKLYTEVLL